MNVQILDLVDPAVAGGVAKWVIVVHNSSSQPNSDVYLTVYIPDAFDFNTVKIQDANAPLSAVPGVVTIGPIRTIRGQETLPRIGLEATARQPGQFKIRVKVESRLAPTVENENDITILPRG
jgi:hypothetical protein